LEVLNQLNPNALAALLVIWVLREVFGFISKLQKEKAGKNELEVVLQAFNRVAENIENQTDLIREFTYELKVLQKKVDSLEQDVNNVRKSL
jgi:peptidoglycan hydrolase CwlO-like protein